MTNFLKMTGITILVFAIAVVVLGVGAWGVAMLVYWDAFWPDLEAWTTYRAGFASMLVLMLVALGQQR